MTAPTAIAGAPGAPNIQAGSLPATATAAGAGPVKKIVVAVHGIGDQYSYATIQSVVNQFCAFYQEPAAIPLGNFHNGQSAFSISPPYPKEHFERLAFAEVYWAKFPRTLVDDQHTIEDSKKWARTIVERLKMRWKKKGAHGGCRDRDFALLKQVLTEMIQTIAVLDRLSFLADKAGLFTFDLRKLLEDYLGDVQVVTEFAKERGEILQEFARIMNEANSSYPDAEIYIIAHSEGTVVSFLSLVNALSAQQTPDWVKQVRGFMTLGSPIDKHLILWPELFTDAPPAYTPKDKDKIRWRNYYDYGDPVGFALDDARAWLGIHHWNEVFEFTESHDYGFGRYLLPGKAHVDYWTDPDVFGHFIEHVVNEEPQKKAAKPSAPARPAPGNKWWKRTLSYGVPYALVSVLLIVAAYVLFKAVTGAIDPKGEMFVGKPLVTREVAAMAALLLGITVTARIPRLTRSPFWRVAGLVVGWLTAFLYLVNVQSADFFERLGVTLPDWAVAPVLAGLLVLLVGWLSATFPQWGMIPLLVLGTFVVLGKLGYALKTSGAPADVGPLWPVMIGLVGSLYLWWLAALLFDLVFVWHLYIRHARGMQRLDEVLGGSRPKPGARKARTAAVHAPQVLR